VSRTDLIFLCVSEKMKEAKWNKIFQ